MTDDVVVVQSSSSKEESAKTIINDEIISVSTSYGTGTIIDIRVNENYGNVIYVIKLKFGGILYATNKSCFKLTNIKSKNKKNENDNKNDSKEDGCNVMELNVAYEALEQMRKLNLEIQCNEINVKYDETKCTYCLVASSAQGNNNKRRGIKVAYSTCFICASPCCKYHSCSSFRKEEDNTVCIECKHLYSLDYAHDILLEIKNNDNDSSNNTNTKLLKLLQTMYDTYDRTILMLKYASTFYMEEICNELDKQNIWKKKVSIGSSSVGMVSGSLGIAATACLLTATPAAVIAVPSLLIASVFFGGTSSALQTGVEWGVRGSEVTKLASRIISWYGMIVSIRRTVHLLKLFVSHEINDRILSGENKINTNASSSSNKSVIEQMSKNEINNTDRAQNKVNMMLTREGVNTVGSISSNTVAGHSAIVTTTTASTTAATTTAMTAAQFASCAGGALSAAVFVFEGYQIKKGMETLESSPTCPKADLLRKILQELDYIPDTCLLEYECNSYIEDIKTQIGHDIITLSNDDIHDILSNIILIKENTEIKGNDSDSIIEKDIDDDNSTITTKTTTLSEENVNDEGNNNDATNKNTKNNKNIIRSLFSFRRRKTPDSISM